MFLTVLAVLTASAQPVTPDCGGNSQEHGACVAAAVERAEAEMKRYHLAALRRVLTTEHRGIAHAGRSAAVRMEWAQAEFLDYRNAECGALYLHHAEGSIRTSEALACRLDLTNARTHDIWERWLTYPDSTPPILPEPEPVIAR